MGNIMHSFATETVGYSTQTELAQKLNDISKKGLILSVKNYLPTQTNMWQYVQVYYRYEINY